MSSRTLALLFAVLLLSIGSRSGTAESIDGYVVNPATDERVKDVEVGFSIAGPDGTFAEMMRKSTDGEGRFSFSGPFLAKGLAYSLTAHYQDIPYTSSTLEVGAQRQVIWRSSTRPLTRPAFALPPTTSSLRWVPSYSRSRS